MSKFSKPSLNQGSHIKVHELESTDTDKQSPLFCLEHLQKGYCLSDCNDQERGSFLNSLFIRRNVPWIDLKTTHRHKLGSEKIHSNAIKASIPNLTLIKPDTTFLAFRFDCMKPMVGFRVGRVFYVLWLDTKFKLYNH